MKALLSAGFLVVLCALSTQAQTGSPGCSSQQQANYPKATISNGQVEAVLYLPDAKNGYYRASRFDWSGVIPCLAYKGHTYFGVWFPHYDPLLADSITGPVEEFRSSDGALDYGQAKSGELFVKLGVGVLRKKDDSAYQFMYPYPLVDGGKWTRFTPGPARCLSGNSCNRPLASRTTIKKPSHSTPTRPSLSCITA